jgi:hypothetical protein
MGGYPIGIRIGIRKHPPTIREDDESTNVEEPCITTMAIRRECADLIKEDAQG